MMRNPNSKVLNKYVNHITQSYAQHCQKVEAGLGWAKGTDVVGTDDTGGFYIDDITAHSYGVVMAVMTGQKNGSLDKYGFGYGNYVLLVHPTASASGCYYVTMYAHLDEVDVKKIGSMVSSGDIIGRMGNTGNSYGAHLHFELRKYKESPKAGDIYWLHDTDNFEWLDPEPYLNAALPKAEPEPSEDFSKNTVPNRFRVIVDGKQKGAYTRWAYAVRYADKVKGYIIDGTNGRLVYMAK